jgi:hypothetical protein
MSPTEFGHSGLRVAAIAAAATLLAGCWDTHTDRRQFISLATGDAVATNKVTHMIDPWPPVSGNRNIAYSGERMQAAAERYRTGRVIPPASAMTSSVGYTQSQQQTPSVATTSSSSNSSTK